MSHYRPPHQRGSSGRDAGRIASTKEELDNRHQRFNTAKTDTAYGLISRGEDSRLQRNPEARRAFFDTIRNDFSEAFADPDYESLTRSIRDLSVEKKGSEDNEQISKVLMSLRKLREALLSAEPDDFSKSVFLFSVRVSARLGHHQTYVPSINYLLKNKHIMSNSELREVANIHVLHLAHFNNDNQQALEAYFKYANDDLKLSQVLLSWRMKDYINWLELLHGEKDVARRRIMAYGEVTIVAHAIECIQKAYFKLPRSYVKRVFHTDVETLKKRYRCNWAVADDTVIIRVRK